MVDDHIAKQRLALLASLALLLADTWCLVAAGLDGFRRVGFSMFLLGAARQAFGVRATVRKVANVTPSREGRKLFIVACLSLGAAGVWYGPLHGGEARVSPSIWKQR